MALNQNGDRKSPHKVCIEPACPPSLWGHWLLFSGYPQVEGKLSGERRSHLLQEGRPSGWFSVGSRDCALSPQGDGGQPAEQGGTLVTSPSHRLLWAHPSWSPSLPVRMPASGPGILLWDLWRGLIPSINSCTSKKEGLCLGGTGLTQKLTKFKLQSLTCLDPSNVSHGHVFL